jgi:hypothetical protein
MYMAHTSYLTMAQCNAMYHGLTHLAIRIVMCSMDNGLFRQGRGGGF